MSNLNGGILQVRVIPSIERDANLHFRWGKSLPVTQDWHSKSDAIAVVEFAGFLYGEALVLIVDISPVK